MAMSSNPGQAIYPGSVNPTTITMDSNKSITANFNAIANLPPNISAIPNTLIKNEGQTISRTEIEPRSLTHTIYGVWVEESEENSVICIGF